MERDKKDNRKEYDFFEINTEAIDEPAPEKKGDEKTTKIVDYFPPDYWELAF